MAKLKVFGIGLSRTGTSSLSIALRILGWNSVHYPKKIEEIRGHGSATDVSVALWYKILDRRYSNSKFILTVREMESWLTSMEWILGKRRSSASLARRCMVYGVDHFDAKALKIAYVAHSADVKDYFRDRSSDLLVLNICAGEGWEKLCPFLGVRVPGKRFPHRNKRRDRGS